MEEKTVRIKAAVLTALRKTREKCLQAKHPGIDGILVTVGLCIIALVLCVFMKDELTTFIGTIVGQMTTKATEILGASSP